MAEFRFKCPYCQKSLRQSEQNVGRAVQCPVCKGRLTVPLPQPGSLITKPKTAMVSVGGDSSQSGSSTASAMMDTAFAADNPLAPKQEATGKQQAPAPKAQANSSSEKKITRPASIGLSLEAMMSQAEAEVEAHATMMQSARSHAPPADETAEPSIEQVRHSDITQNVAHHPLPGDDCTGKNRSFAKKLMFWK